METTLHSGTQGWRPWGDPRERTQEHVGEVLGEQDPWV